MKSLIKYLHKMGSSFVQIVLLNQFLLIIDISLSFLVTTKKFTKNMVSTNFVIFMFAITRLTQIVFSS